MKVLIDDDFSSCPHLFTYGIWALKISYNPYKEKCGTDELITLYVQDDGSMTCNKAEIAYLGHGYYERHSVDVPLDSWWIDNGISIQVTNLLYQGFLK